MSIDVTTLGIDRLSVKERLDLIDQIWDSLPDQVNPTEVPAWHLAEIAKRRDLANPGLGKPWREVLAELKKSP